MKRLTTLLALMVSCMAFAQERTFEVTITNVTKSQIFAPPVAVTHDGSYHMWRLGEPASEALALMAEDGNAGMLRDAAMESDRVTDAQLGGGMIMPGQSQTITVTSSGYADTLSVAGMLVTTNDAFFAADLRLPGIQLFKRAVALPTNAMAYVYDAGSEANTEDCAHIPGPPCGSMGVRVTDGAEGYVHPHSGIHGIADVSAADYDWGPIGAVISIRAVN